MRGLVLVVLAALGALLLLALVALLALFSRVRSLTHRVGSFECALRTPTGWASGIAHYATDRIRWYRTMSYSPRAAAEWLRAELAVTERVAREGTTDGPSGVLEVTMMDARGPVMVAMSRAAYAGLASWLEAAPPRERVG